jgi:lipoyl(octanoyl) transferase
MTTLDQTSLQIRHLPLSPFQSVWEKMYEFTEQRDANTPDEIWFLQHSPVYTLGQAGKIEHILNPHDIPIVHTDRGGQVTYHGPGQLVVYFLLDLRRLKLGIRDLVIAIENTVIDVLKQFEIIATSKREAPGVYVESAKIASIGLRVRKGSTYHGLSFNLDMDLTPFTWINPCGFTNLKMTQLADYIDKVDMDLVKDKFINSLLKFIPLRLV